MKTGVLYERKKRRKHGEVDIAAIVKKLKLIAGSLRWSGAVLMGLAVFGIGVIFQPLIEAEVRYALYPPRIEKPSKFGPLVDDWANWDVPNNDYSVFIPKIGAKSQIIGDVDAADEKAYNDALKKGVAAARGLASPGDRGTTYLFAHSTDSPLNYARFNAVFYLLDKLEVGDGIEVVYKDKLYKYTAASKEILAAEDVRYLVPQHDEEKLVLQTCYPPGTTWKRLVIVAKRI